MTRAGGSGIATVWRPDGTSEQLHSGDQPTFATWIRNGWVLGGNVGTVVPFHTVGLPLVRWVIPLPLPPGTADGVGFVATTISDNGKTVGGQANLTNGDIVPVRWLCH